MLRNIIRSQRYSNKEIFYTRRKGHGCLYLCNNYIIKTFDTSKPDYKNEYSKLTSIKHPNVIAVKDSFYESDFFNTVMPYYSRGDLFHQFFDNCPPTREDILAAARKLVKPVSHMHKKGIIHLDIKPENYVQGDHNEYIMLDFEHARWFQQDYHNLITLPKIVGTKKYMAPEIKQLQFGPTSDVYSVGRMIYLIIARHFPDDVEIDWEPIRKRAPELEELVVAMLQPNHRLRPTIFDIYQHINALLYCY